MELATLSKTYGNFLAPAFYIRLGGSDLMRDLLVAVNQVEVDLVLGTMSRFSFTVVNSYDIEKQKFLTGHGEEVLDLLTFGTDVDICMGYGERQSAPVLIKGMITEISTNFPESGSPELVISGYDHIFPLTLGTYTRTWTKRSDSDAVHAIASFSNMNANIETTPEHRAQIEQNQVSDFGFMQKLAKDNFFELYVDGTNTLHFHKPDDDATAVIRLAWGAGLLSFKPEANLASQITKVEVYGWDINSKKPIVGNASAGEESGLRAGEKSAGQRLKTFVRDPEKQPVLRLRQPVFTQAEADQRAKAILNERAKQFVTGEGEAIGLPDVRPGRNVFLAGLGKPFSATYYVEEATHKIDANGYRTRFKVRVPGL